MGTLLKHWLAHGNSWKYSKNLALGFEGRESLTIPETFSGGSYDAAILPALGKYDGSNYASRLVSNFDADKTSGYVEARVYYSGAAGTIYLLTSANTASSTIYVAFLIINGYPYIRVRNATYNNINGQTLLTVGWNTVRFASDGSAYTITLNGVESGLNVGAGANNGNWFSSVPVRSNLNIGANILFTSAYSSGDFNVAWIDYNGTNKWYCTGAGGFCYDIVGNMHLTWVGSDHQVFSVGASTHLLDVGYSLWRKGGSPDEYVPFTDGGVAVDVSAFLADYTKVADCPGSLTGYNGAPSVIDFDPSNSGDVVLDIFKKDNATIFTATANMLYYNAAEVYRWRNDELMDPKIYSDTYRNVGYMGMVFNVSSVNENDIVTMITGILAYSVDNTDGNEWRVVKYCALDSLVVTSGGQPVYDVNEYLIWI